MEKGNEQQGISRDKEVELLLKRFNAAGRAQSRYMYLLLLLTVFFLLLDHRILREPDYLKYSINNIAWIGLDVPVVAIWTLGPPILSFVLLAVLGTFQMLNTTLGRLEEHLGKEKSSSEIIDETPNLIDVAVYTSPKSPRFGHALALLSYPVFLTLIFFAIYYLTNRVLFFSSSWLRCLVSIFTLCMWPFVLWRLGLLWRGKVTSIKKLQDKRQEK
jgi:hypothetical protein